jgi:hypothetical protein
LSLVGTSSANTSDDELFGTLPAATNVSLQASLASGYLVSSGYYDIVGQEPSGFFQDVKQGNSGSDIFSYKFTIKDSNSNIMHLVLNSNPLGSINQVAPADFQLKDVTTGVTTNAVLGANDLTLTSLLVNNNTYKIILTLPHNFTGTMNIVGSLPIPGALVLFGSALCALGAVGMRGRRGRMAA